MKRHELARLIDHTLLKPEASAHDARDLALEALDAGCASACVNPNRVAVVNDILAESLTRTCSVIGFPFGASPTDVKVRETELVAALGANEFDMVIDFGKLREGDTVSVSSDVAAVRSATPPGAILKVILETAVLTPSQIHLGCLIAEAAGADFVKTSTGFHSAGGASAAAVELMRRVVPNLGVKASGGIRDLRTALQMLDAGATRLGMSATLAVLGELSA